MVGRALVVLSALAVVVGCHLALGIEKAETVPDGVVSECNDDVDCDDNNACTTDRCDERVCIHDPLDGDAPEQTTGDCQRVVCAASTPQSTPDDADLPVDGQECTGDVCTAGQPSNPSLAGGTGCVQDGGKVCNGDGRCTECFDNTDCTMPETCMGGGAPFVCGCTPTACSDLAFTCGFAPNGPGTCGNALNCSNGMQDGTETDVDCGGSVSTCNIRCETGEMCMVTSDCANPLTCQGGTCQ